MNGNNETGIIRNWPSAERPREKMMENGPAALSDAELLAVLLRTGTRGKDAVAFSRDLVGQFGGLRGLMKQDLNALRKIKGLGPAKIASLLSATELARRQLKERVLLKDVVRDPQGVFEYLSFALRDRQKELFKVLYLNKANALIGEKDLFAGTVDEAAVHPREIVQSALERHATAVILVHNHPSGRTQPSREDVEITKKIKAACESVSIRVLDHVIIGHNDYFSFNQNKVVF